MYLAPQDTLGSVGVIISTVMIEYTGWTVFDPIASLFIAALIVASVVPLVIDSARVLMLELGEEKEEELRHALAEVRFLSACMSSEGPADPCQATRQLNAVEGLEFYAAPRFWPKSEGSLVGSVHIRLSPVKAFEDPSRPASESAWAFKKQGGVTYADADKVVAKVENVLKSRIRGLRDLTIQVEGLDCTFCPCSTGAGR
jgi:zinc transporter 5/7